MSVGNVVVGSSASTYYVVSKDSKNPEAAIKMMNKFIDVDNVIPNEETDKFHKGKESDAYWKLNPVIVGPMDANARAGGELAKAVEANDASMVQDNVTAYNYFNDIVAYKGGDASRWSSWMAGKPHGSLDIMNQYLTNNQFWFNNFTGPSTETMASKKSVLDQKENELFTKIIIGKASIDEFDKFVSDWKSLGGDQITQEVNDWYAKQGQ